MSIQFVLLAIGSYLLGSVPAAYLAVRWSRGLDIREQGTGNVGASNVLSTGPKWLAIPVALFDIGKSALCVWVAQLLGMGAALQATAGILAIIGHNWPVFLHFRGGRGIFTSLGVITMLSPKLGLIILVSPYLLAPFRQLAIGVFMALISLPLFAWFLTGPLGIEERLPATLGLAAIAVIGLSRRLMTTRTALSRSMPLGRLITNRLLFDRDIADRKAWITRAGSGGADAAEPPLEPQEKPS